MEETFFKRVNVKEELPTETEVFDTNLGALKFCIHPQSKATWWKTMPLGTHAQPIFWYKPLLILSRDELIKTVEIKKSDFKQYSCPKCNKIVRNVGILIDNFCPSCGSKITWK